MGLVVQARDRRYARGAVAGAHRTARRRRMPHQVYDPIAMDECRRRFGDMLVYCGDMYDALLDADALLLVTEWKEFRLPAWPVVKKAMRRPLVIDGRNIFDAEELAENGFEYHCIGK